MWIGVGVFMLLCQPVSQYFSHSQDSVGLVFTGTLFTEHYQVNRFLVYIYFLLLYCVECINACLALLRCVNFCETFCKHS